MGHVPHLATKQWFTLLTCTDSAILPDYTRNPILNVPNFLLFNSCRIGCSFISLTEEISAWATRARDENGA